MTAREVAARYLAAMAEAPHPGEPLAAFRATRNTAQELGACWEEVKVRGVGPVLAECGYPAGVYETSNMAAQAITAVIAGCGGGLEDAVIRSSLASVVFEALASPEFPDAAQVVRRFLAAAVHRRLALDLGESLEAAARGYTRLHEGLARVQAEIEAAAATPGAAAPPPSLARHWKGLPGWTWATDVMTEMIKSFG